ncbi:MAG: VCBS repeat-containing protein [Prevotella sp.]|nr:VCBS repeat-containing protein [Prevotella sp.]
MKYYTHIIISFLLALFFTQEILATEVVGSPKGQFAVSSTGAATYSVSIDVPPGISGLQPQVGIMYNSQSGLGNVGWGCNITGVSAITRGVKDIYHDGTAKGMSYGNDDAYYLDGKRLIYVSGTEGEVGCLYHPEGEPYTDVEVKEAYSTNYDNRYFEVTQPNGLVMEYGKYLDSRQYVYDSTFYNSFWYLSKVTDRCDRSIIYTYSRDNTNKYTYLASISYAGNTISFNYASLGAAAQIINQHGVTCKKDSLLTSIVCKTGTSVFRSYNFSYNQQSDGTAVKYPRLNQIEVMGTDGNYLSPISFGWDYLQAYDPYSNTPSVSESILPPNAPSNLQIKDRQFYSGDLNGDGFSDLVEICECEGTGGNSSAYIGLHSSMAPHGSWFANTSAISINTNSLINLPWYRRLRNGSIGDFDGDGVSDFFLSYYNLSGNTSKVVLYPFFLSEGNGFIPSDTIECLLSTASYESPLYAVTDVNNDGRNEFLIFENAASSQSRCHVISTDVNRNVTISNEYFSFPIDIRRVFAADFNGDGLQDLMMITDDGYSLYWNRGNLPTSAFPFGGEQFGTGILYHVSGDDVQYVRNIDLGDFNGDGLPDLILNEENSNQYYFALNNGDGSFTLTSGITIDVFDEAKDEDDDKYVMIVNDFDKDGKSDVFLAHAHYIHHGGLSPYNSFDHTDIRWYRSTGSSLALMHSVQTKNEKDAQVGHIDLGDFYGNGFYELVNYGSNLTVTSTAAVTPVVRVISGGYGVSHGKIKTITDGFGNTTQISYSSLTSPSIFTKGSGSSYPLVDLAVPIHVVDSVKTPTVATSSPSSLMTESYSYEGLKAHMAGRGLLGFAKTTVTNDTIGRAVVNETGGWASNDYFVPTSSTTTTYIGSVGSNPRSTTTTTLTVANKNSGTRKNFFAYPSTIATTDFDNYTTTTTNTFDTTKGVPTLEKTVYDGNANTNYKQVEYTYGSTKYGGQWLPIQIVRTQRHPNDTQTFSTRQDITYDALTGLPTVIVDNAHNTNLNLTTTNVYGIYSYNLGILLNQTRSGYGLNAVTKKYEYDTTQRFVTKEYTVPSSTVTTYTYDLWGNVLTETDATVSSNPLTTTNTYDGFGNLLTSTTPEGIVTAISRSWGNSATQKYLVHKTVTGRPFTKVWYDSRGRETKTESVGEKGITLQNTTSYDSRGNIVSKTSQTGDITTSETLQNDNRGRMTSDVLSTGRSTSYTYTGRKVTATTNGSRVFEKTYDAWGLLTQSKEPIGTVTYRYKSCGKPSQASTGNGTVTMAYDDCGNQTSLADSDAGTTTYSYNAAGEVVSQTDARSITITHTRDNLNRITQTTTGSTVTTYTYGTSGNATQRLTNQATGSYGISYAYDQYGRVTSETRNFGNTSYTTSYTYDSNNNLQKTTYPGSVEVTYGYDSNGYETSMAVNGSTVWTLTSHSGTATLETLGTGTTALKRSTSHNSYDLLTGITLQKASNNTQLHTMTFTHNAVTGNLTQRTGMISDGEVFTYDNDDRLVRHQDVGSHYLDNIVQYGQDGNVEFKTGIGNFGYPPGGKAHAVGNVTNTNGYVSSAGQSVVYNDLSKASEIYYAHGNSGHLYLDYGPDGQRWKAELYKSSTQYPDTVRYYVGDMEGYKVGSSETVWFYHIGHGVILRKVGLASNTQPTKYYAFTDHLGSVTRIYNSSGTAVFSAQYDPWGVQTVTTNAIGYNRGYCGHEMLNDFQLINMNGRLYDPYIARFLSPDNYVQLPTSAQSFNRYSYCLNNPLKYVDPDGELFLFSLFSGFVHGVINMFNGGKITDPLTFMYKNFVNEMKVDWGLFKGSSKQILSRFTWEIPQTIVGFYYSHFRLATRYIDHVGYYDGATYVYTHKYANGFGGVTIGNYINIDTKEPWPRDVKGRFDPSKSNLFMHEYGHYLQSQEYGWGYLFSVGIPSLKSAIRDHNWFAEIEDKTRTENRFVVSKHMTHWFEISANRKAAKYFSGRGVVWDYKKYPLNISKILSYFQYDNNYNRINIKYL